MDIQITEISPRDGWFSDMAELVGKKIIAHNLHRTSDLEWYGGAVQFKEPPISEMPNKIGFFFSGVKYKPWTS
jgi:hypothetical protein